MNLLVLYLLLQNVHMILITMQRGMSLVFQILMQHENFMIHMQSIGVFPFANAREPLGKIYQKMILAPFVISNSIVVKLEQSRRRRVKSSSRLRILRLIPEIFARRTAVFHTYPNYLDMSFVIGWMNIHIR